MIDFIRSNFEGSSAIEDSLKNLADKTAWFLGQDELSNPVEKKIAKELVNVLQVVPRNEWNKLLDFYAGEAIKSFGTPLPSVAEDIKNAVNIARNWLENPDNLE